MRIERQRVRAGKALEHRPEIVGETKKRAVRAVDVVPEALARTQVRHGVERIDGAGIGRAGVRHDGKRRQALPDDPSVSRRARASTSRR